MPLVYADSSVLFAYFHPNDEFSTSVDSAVLKNSPGFVYWPCLRFELRHNLRMARVNSDGEVAWRALRAAQKTSSRLRWQAELTPDKMLMPTRSSAPISRSNSVVAAQVICTWQRHVCRRDCSR